MINDLPWINPPEWHLSALCAQVDPDMWFPELGGTAQPAKRICRRCPVQTECLEYALTNWEPFGVYGGTTPQERRRLRNPDAA